MSELHERVQETPWQDEDVFAKVPADKTYGWLTFLMIFIGMWTSAAAIAAGIALGGRMSPRDASLGILVGYIICMAYGYLVGMVGVRERLATYPLLARPFSTAGTFVPALFVFLLGGTFIGVQADAATRVIATVAGIKEVPLFGPVTNWGIMSALLCSFMMFTAYMGIRYIGVVSWVSMPMYCTFIAVIVVLSMRSHPGGLAGLLGIVKEGGGTFSDAVFMGVSLYAGFTGLMPDVSRFVKTERDLRKAIVIGYLAASLVPISGVLMGAAFPGKQYWEILGMFGLGVGLYGCIAIFLAQWTTNDNNAFTAGLALSTSLRCLKSLVPSLPAAARRRATLVPIVMGIVLAGVGAGATAPLLNAVGTLGSWLPPMSGVFLGHYYVVERKGKAVHARGLAALVAWIAVSVLVHTGRLPWPALSGVIGGLVAYVILYYLVELPLFGNRASTLK